MLGYVFIQNYQYKNMPRRWRKRTKRHSTAKMQSTRLCVRRWERRWFPRAAGGGRVHRLWRRRALPFRVRRVRRLCLRRVHPRLGLHPVDGGSTWLKRKNRRQARRLPLLRRRHLLCPMSHCPRTRTGLRRYRRKGCGGPNDCKIRLREGAGLDFPRTWTYIHNIDNAISMRFPSDVFSACFFFPRFDTIHCGLLRCIGYKY